MQATAWCHLPEPHCGSEAIMDLIREIHDIHGLRCGEGSWELGSPGQCPPNVSQKVSRLVALMPWWLEAGPSSASASRGCVAHCNCSSLIRFPRRICAFALHCISLRACGSSHHMSHSATRLRYLALVPIWTSAGCDLFLSMCHIRTTTTSSTLHDSLPCFHNIS